MALPSKSSLQALLKTGLVRLKQRQVKEAREIFGRAAEAFPTQAAAHLLLGIAAARSQEPVLAASALSKAIELEPDHIGNRTKAAKALVRIHRPYQALNILRIAVEKDSKDPKLLELYFNIALRVGWYWEAFDAMYRAIDADPTNQKRKINASRLLYNLRDHDAALLRLKDVFLEKNISAEAFYLQSEILKEVGRLEEAVDAVDQALSRQERTPKNLIQAADHQIQLGGLENARKNAQETLSKDANSLPALLMLGNFELWEGQAPEAKTYAIKVEALEPNNPDARRLMAGALILEGELDQATPILNQLIEDNEQDGVALLLRGELKRNQKKYNDAVTDIDMGIIHSRGYAVQGHISRLLTITQFQCQHEGMMAKDAFAELLELVKPMLPEPEKDVLCNGVPNEVRRLMAHAFSCFEGNRTPQTTYIRRDDPKRVLKRLHIQAHSRFASRYAQELIRTRPVEEVLALFDEMIADDKDNPIVYTHLGEVLLWLGRYEESLVEFKKSIAITPMVRWAYIGLCANEMMLEKYEEGIEWCKRGLKAFPPPGRTMFPYRAEIYRRMGKLDLALKDIKRAQEITPGRMTGWMNEAIIYELRGDSSLLVPAYQKVVERSPCLVETALMELNLEFPLESPDPDKITPLFDHMMQMMRGNRSSDFVTYFTEAGEFRFVPPPDIPDLVFNN